MRTILPELERDLHRAAERRLRERTQGEDTSAKAVSGHRIGSRRRLAAALPLTATALIALLVAGGAVALLVRSPAHRTTPPGHAAVAPTRQALIRSLEILRRPQTPAAQTRQVTDIALGINSPMTPHSGLRQIFSAAGKPRLDRPLVRVVDVADAHAHIVVAPVRYTPRHTSGRSEGIILTIAGLDGRLNSTGPTAASPTALRARGLTLLPALMPHPMPGAALVPDGVARVVLGASRLGPEGVPGGTSARELRPVLSATATSANVRGNVAIIRLRRTPTIRMGGGATNSGIGFAVRTPEIWYSASGRVVRRLWLNTTLVVRVIDSATHHPYPVNSHGETYGSAAGAAKPTTEPDLISVIGRRPDGSRVEGYVKRTQLNANSCADVKTPKQAVRCTKHNSGRKRTIPVYARNGTTVLGNFSIG